MSEGPGFLLLIHQIPPEPGYLRVKIGRRLQALGAVAVKNSVYVLPRGEQALEDFQWVRREIVAGGGDATICAAAFVEGLEDGGVRALFDAARDADYQALAEDAQALRQGLARAGKRRALAPERAAAALVRLKKRLQEIVAMDFYGATGRAAAETQLAALEAALRPPAAEERRAEALDASDVRARTWVTRAGIQVDRLASAWLIRRFIDPQARFKFVAEHDYEPSAGELRFDMFEADFTHEGDACTFEVLLRRFGLERRGLVELGEIVHDLDLKDSKYARPEAAGLERLLAGLALRHAGDEARLADGATLFESLYAYFESRS